MQSVQLVRNMGKMNMLMKQKKELVMIIKDIQVMSKKTREFKKTFKHKILIYNPGLHLFELFSVINYIKVIT